MMKQQGPNQTQSPQRWVAALERVKSQSTEREQSQSEPGARTTEHDRFAAYINRFSSMDQRMQFPVARPTGDAGGSSDRRSPHTEQSHAKGNSLTQSAFQAAVRSRQQQQQDPWTTPTRSSSFRSRMLERHGGIVAQYKNRSINVRETKSDTGVGSTAVTSRMRSASASRTPVRTRRSLSREKKTSSTRKLTEDAISRSRPTTPTRGSGARMVTPTAEEPRSRPTTPTQNVKRLLDYRRSIQELEQQQQQQQPDDGAELPSMIQQIDDRAEIETPSPARVSYLRQKLWTDQEHLKVQWKKQNSLGPQHGSKLKTGLASPEEGRRFKERYYAAAQRGKVQQEAKKVVDLEEKEETVSNMVSKLGPVHKKNQLRAQAQEEEGQLSADDDESSEDSSVSSITDPTYEEVSKLKVGQNSAIANRRTSALAKYAKPMKVVNGSSGNGKLRRRKHRGAFPSAEEVHSESNKEAQPIATRSFAQIKRDIERQDDIRDEDVSDSGILDTCTDELEQKIKRWDELSTGVIPTKNEEPTLVGKKDNVAKSHPWEGGISPRSVAGIRRQQGVSRINVRETTMDSADGIEAEYASPVRKLRQERLLREYRPSAIVEEGGAHDEGPAEHVEAFDEFLPAFQPRREKTKAMAEEYDSAWINLPHSRYFGQQSQERSSLRSSKNSPGGVLRHLPHGEVEVGYVNMDSIDADQAISTGYRDMKVGQHEAVRAEDTSSKSNNNLKGFLNRRSDYARRGEQMTYTSTGSRRYQDLKAKLEAMNGQREPPAMSARASSNQSRSRSLDERRENTRSARNPNLAKKFSRMLKVYDENKSRSLASR